MIIWYDIHHPLLTFHSVFKVTFSPDIQRGASRRCASHEQPHLKDICLGFVTNHLCRVPRRLWRSVARLRDHSGCGQGIRQGLSQSSVLLWPSLSLSISFSIPCSAFSHCRCLLHYAGEWEWWWMGRPEEGGQIGSEGWELVKYFCSAVTS